MHALVKAQLRVPVSTRAGTRRACWAASSASGTQKYLLKKLGAVTANVTAATAMDKVHVRSVFLG